MYSTITMKYVAYKKGPLAHQGHKKQKQCVHIKPAVKKIINKS